MRESEFKDGLFHFFSFLFELVASFFFFLLLKNWFYSLQLEQTLISLSAELYNGNEKRHYLFLTTCHKIDGKREAFHMYVN